MTPASSTSEKTQQRLFQNIGLKFTSLLIAILVWFAVSSAPRIEVAFDVPVEFRNVLDGLEVTSDNIPQAEVRVRGPSRVVRGLKSADLHLVLDLSGFPLNTAGDHTFNLSASQVKAPPGVEIVQVVPSYLRLSFDKRGVRKIEVRARVMGSFAPGYKIASVTVDPPEVTIVGPEKHVSQMEAAMTDPIDASGVMGTHTFLAAPHVQDPLIRFSQPTPVRVTVVTEKTK